MLSKEFKTVRNFVVDSLLCVAVSLNHQITPKFTSLGYSDIEVIYDGIGDKLGIFIQWSTTFVAGIVIAFVRHWELTFWLLAKKAGLIVMIKLLIKLLSRLVSRLVSRLLNKVGGDTMRGYTE